MARFFFLRTYHIIDARACVWSASPRVVGGVARWKRRLASMASGWNYRVRVRRTETARGKTESGAAVVSRGRSESEWESARVHKKCIVSGRGSGRMQGVSRAPRRRRFLLINIKYIYAAAAAVTVVWPEPRPPARQWLAIGRVRVRAAPCPLIRDARVPIYLRVHTAALDVSHNYNNNMYYVRAQCIYIFMRYGWTVL